MSYFKLTILTALLTIFPYLMYGQNSSGTRWLVKYPSTQEKEAFQHRSNAEGLKLTSDLKQKNIQVWESTPNSRSSDEELQRLRTAFPDAIIEKEYTYKLTGIPDDPQFQYQQHLYNTGQNGCRSGVDIAAVPAWDLTTGDTSTVIVIIDGGMDLDHEDLKDNLWRNKGESGLDSLGNNRATNGIDDDGNGYIDDVHGWDFAYDDNEPEDDTYSGHGTHVAGIAAAKGNNGVGIAGVCWNCKIMPLKFTDSTGRGNTSTALAAIEYAIDMKKRGVDIAVINNSWGGGSYSEFLKESIQKADSAGILFVAAAGNDSLNLDRLPFYPASYEVENIISVAATDCEGKLASFSNFGQNSVDIAAQGEAIRSTLPDDKYGYQSGTSMAAPQVAGAVALMRGYRRQASMEQILRTLYDSAKELESIYEGKLIPSQLELWRTLTANPENFWNDNDAYAMTGLDFGYKDDVWTSDNRGNVYQLFPENNHWNIFNSTNSPLPADEITTLVYNHTDSSVWIGTKNNGLARYYRGNWMRLTTDNSPLPSDHISEIILVDTTLWIGTNGGGLVKLPSKNVFYRRMTDAWKIYNVANANLISDNIRAITNNPESEILWMGLDIGLSKMNLMTENIENFHTEEADSLYSNISSIENKTDSSIYIITDKNNLIFADPYENIYSIDPFNNPFRGSEPVDEGVFPFIEETYDMVYDPKRRLTWLSSNLGLIDVGTYVVDWISNFLLYSDDRLLPPPSNFVITRIKVHPDGSIWGATSSGNLLHVQFVYDHYYNPKVQIFSPKKKSLKGFNANTIVPDSGGSIWVGTEGGGLFNINNGKQEIFNTKNSNISSDFIRTIKVNSDGTLWLGTLNGLIKYDRNTFHDQTNLFSNITYHYSGPIDSLNPLFFPVNDIIIGDSTVFWVGTYGHSLMTYNGGSGEERPLISSLGNYADKGGPEFINTLSIDSNRVLWIGTSGGLWTFKDSTLNEGKPHFFAYVNDVIVDLNNNIWAGTNSGLKKIINDPDFNYVVEEIALPIEEDNITSLANDKYGSIWIGTISGDLLRLYNGKWQVYNSTNSPIPQSRISDIYIQEDGTIWLATAGIVSFVPNNVPSFSFEKPVLCKGESQEFISKGLKGDSSEWYINDMLITRDSQLVYTFHEPGSYKIELIVYDSEDTLSAINYITVQEPTQLNLGQDTTSLAPAIFLSPNLPLMNKYEWSDEEGTILSNEANFSVKSSGTYKLTIEDLCGYSSSDDIRVELIGNGNYILPGDVNLNGRVDQEDFFLMGMAHGTIGSQRQDISPNFIPQEATLWNQYFSNSLVDGINYMHADPDGNGVIDIFKDGEFAKQFIKTDQVSQELDGANVNLSLEVLNQEVSIGERIDFQFWLDGDTSKMKETYGIALSLSLNIGLDQDPELYDSPSWLGTPGENLYQLHHFDREKQRIDLVFTRTDLQPFVAFPDIEPSFGRGGTITIIDDIDTTRIRKSHIPLTFTLENVIIVDKDGNRIDGEAISQQRTHNVMISIPSELAIVRLVDFSITCDNNTRQFSWTAWEKNIDRYYLEYASDGETFELVQAFDGARDTLAQKQRFNKHIPDDLTVGFYRLKIIGLQGEIFYSDTITVINCNETITDLQDGPLHNPKSIRLFPNPVENTLYLDLKSIKPSTITLDLINISGQRVFSYKQALPSGHNKIPIDISHLPMGFYITNILKDDVLLKREKVVIRKKP